MVRVTRNYQFSASHRLYLAHLSEEENQKLFGKCANPHGHGHNYTLAVTVEGPIDPRTGLAVNPFALDKLVHGHVLGRIDHSYLNEDVEELRGVPATTENLASFARQALAAAWPADFPALAHIGVRETKRNVIELPVIPQKV
ncbi:MAG: 6-carboxytetrahydropterin synthase [Acidobacteria bacterium]|nr:6-carboxytetrahydropterin synthase [Acidobacteriota bacterium]